jgi:phage N-6-adenine-methyltransferase
MTDPIVHKRKIEVPSSEWQTPPEIFNPWNKIFHFGLDAAASHENALCEKYFTKEDDAFKQDWNGYGNVFLNPPYGQEDGPIAKWNEKCIATASKGNTVVELVKSDTSTKWYKRLLQLSPRVTIIPLPQRVRHLYKGERLIS